MMLGFVGYLSGFDMKMDKIISQSEYDDTSYVNMRIVSYSKSVNH